MTHWRFREEEAVSPQCLRTLSRVASFQSSTVSGPSLFRFGTKRFEGNELSSCLQFANFWFHSRCEMATSKGSPTRTSKVLCSKLLAPTFLPPISLAPQVQWDKILDKWNSCNSDPKKTLGIKLPYLVMIIKNMKKYFTFEVQVRIGWIKTAILVQFVWLMLTKILKQVLDDKNVRRRFRASNYQSTTRWASRDSKETNCYFRVKPFICTMPMRLDDGWNQIQVQESKKLIPSLCPKCILSSTKLQECISSISSHNCISSSTWPISHGEPMAQTMWRPWG